MTAATPSLTYLENYTISHAQCSHNVMKTTTNNTNNIIRVSLCTDTTTLLVSLRFAAVPTYRIAHMIGTWFQRLE